MSTSVMRKYYFTIGLAFTLSLCMGCSLNTVGNFGNTLIEAASDVNIFTDLNQATSSLITDNS